MLTRLVGGTPELSFRTDPTLVAGIELATPHAGDSQFLAGGSRKDHSLAAARYGP